MEAKFNFLKRTFDDVFGGGYNPKTYTTIGYHQTLAPTASYVYVNDCVFSYCSSTTHGGAIYCSSSVYKLLVEQSTIISCRTSNQRGGGISFYNTESRAECVFSKVCGFNCSSTNSGSSWGQFADTYLNRDDANNKNQARDCSISHTSNEGTTPHYALCLEYGNILCTSVNLTNNECVHYSALACWSVVSSTSDTCYISYNSIVNNTANGGYSCILLGGYGSSQFINTCNILNNKQTSSNYGIIYSNANVFIKDSCIIGNNEGKCVFFISSTSYKITISNSTLDDDMFTSVRYSGNVIVNKTIKKMFINALSHIITYKCDSYFDSFGTLKVNTNAPSKSSRLLMSCINNYAVIDPFRSIKFIFLLTMLPSDHYFNSNCHFHTTFVNN
jgi:predicted outer membrane repeat protein